MRKLTFTFAVFAATLLHSQGIIRLIAGGGTGTFCGDGGAANVACISTPGGLAVDNSETLYIADTANHRIRKVTLGGQISTIAGTGFGAFSGDGGPATSASLNLPTGLAFDNKKGNLYILDSGNNRIRVISSTGVITTIAGNGLGGFSGDNGPAAQALINPLAGSGGLAIDTKGDLYLTDTGNNRIRAINTNGVIFTIAGNGQAGFAGDGSPGTLAMLNAPNGSVDLDAAGNIYIPDTLNGRLRMLSTTGNIITTVAGLSAPGYNGDGFAPSSTALSSPAGVAYDGSAIYVADGGNNRVRRVALLVATVAGGGTATPPVDGLVSSNLLLNFPAAIAGDNVGNIFVADRNKRVFKVLSPSLASTGPIALSSTALTFNAESNGDIPDAQQVQLSSLTLLPFSFSTSAATVSGGNWLSVTPLINRLPSTLRIKADPTGVAPGTYQGSVTVNVPQSTTSPVIPVTFVVAPIPPALTVTHNELNYSAIAGIAGPLTLQTRILNTGGGGPLTWTATASTLNGGNWLVPLATSGTTAFTLQVQAQLGSLKTAGLYQGSITITSGALRQVIKVTLMLNPSAAVLKLGQAGATFNAQQGAGPLAPQTLDVINLGAGPMPWSAVVTNATTAPWLKISPSFANTDPTTPATITLSADATGLAQGTYHAQIRVGSPGATNSPAFATVVLNVSGPAANTPLRVFPGGLFFQAAANGTAPTTQTVTAAIGGANAVGFTASAGTLDVNNWLEVSPESGTIPPGATGIPLTAVVDPSGLAAGTYAGFIDIALSDGGVRSATVILLVRPAGTTVTIQSTRGPDTATCVPAKLLPTPTGLVNNFQAAVAWPAQLRAVVTDDCGNLIDNATVITTFSNGDPPIVLTNVKGGNYTGSWQPGGNAAQITVTTTAMGAGLSTGVVKIIGVAGPNQVPQMTPNGAVHAASFTPLAPLAPGSMFSIFGSNLDPAAQGVLATTLPLPNLLDQLSAALGDTFLPLYYAGPNQVNAQIPFEATAGSTATLVIKSGTQYTVPQSIVLSVAQPGIFTQLQNGSGPGVILDVNYKLVTAANPVKPGDAIQIYCAGLGATNPPAPTGDKPPTAGLYLVSQTVTATVNGVAANVEFAGAVAGFAGLYQVNVRIPASAPNGNVNLILFQGGIPSNTVTVAIKQ